MSFCGVAATTPGAKETVQFQLAGISWGMGIVGHQGVRCSDPNFETSILPNPKRPQVFCQRNTHTDDPNFRMSWKDHGRSPEGFTNLPLWVR